MIALASDHAGFELKKSIKRYLEVRKLEYIDFGVFDTNRVDYPEFALKAANAVVKQDCEKGILFCGTGVGISIAANKVRGIRCVVCSEPNSALLSRQHNDTNMLALGGRVIREDMAIKIVETWLDGKFEGGQHQLRIDQITNIEKYGNINNQSS
jgi:ribose 5-phosphate isomerase B